MSMVHKEVELGEKGRVVIPQEVRKALGAAPGDRLVFTLEDGIITVTTRARLVKNLRGKYHLPNRNLTEELSQERAQEADGKTW
ncbi:AbrB/MazE/SpoVT family DNA-binding domain-containing protein [Deinococcus yavapaiensis]|uniref:AbrB family looped-hinge helix DNA binding protein n=1 Tax=Deinococcus yavapaiensis KR-236 TaxID=694435 RepID=A0A318S3P9_9DEIO|nr:AbrB/MazE/SpoVT family DNA-binding domain-containing protein [Deinococcus yavapaiensis]PYE50989.1 AbrB family looped-hinge helix DNA binding protein [Deinococcus yavapaiensis KR-236]